MNMEFNMNFGPKKVETPKVENSASDATNHVLRELIQREIESKILKSNPQEKYRPGTLAVGDDKEQGYMERVNKLVDIALANPESDEFKKAKLSLESTFKSKENIEQEQRSIGLHTAA